MKHRSQKSIALLTMSAFVLASCGGGGSSDTGGGGGGPISVTPTPTPTPTPTAGCALAARQAFAKAVIDEWYLFPSDVANGVSPASHANVQSYIDALVAPARALGKDRFFTYITSIAEENAFFSSGSSAGFGIRLTYDAPGQRVVIAEAYENAPAFAAGIDRGTAIVGIGTNSGNVRTVASIVAAEGTAGITNALGPNDPGVTRVLRITDAAGTREITVAKADYDLDPISSRYGARIIQDGGRQIGYLNLRTFISAADTPLRDAFRSFRAAGVTEFIVDFRYNGGGLISTAELLGDLLGGNRTTAELFSGVRFRASQIRRATIAVLHRDAESMRTRIAFIGTGSTAEEFVRQSDAALSGHQHDAGRQQHFWQTRRPDRARQGRMRRSDARGRLCHRQCHRCERLLWRPGPQDRQQLRRERRPGPAAGRRARGVGARRDRLPGRSRVHNAHRRRQRRPRRAIHQCVGVGRTRNAGSRPAERGAARTARAVLDSN